MWARHLGYSIDDEQMMHLLQRRPTSCFVFYARMFSGISDSPLPATCCEGGYGSSQGGGYGGVQGSYGGGGGGKYGASAGYFFLRFCSNPALSIVDHLLPLSFLPRPAIAIEPVEYLGLEFEREKIVIPFRRRRFYTCLRLLRDP